MWLQATLLENLCIPMGDSQDYLSIHPTLVARLSHLHTYVSQDTILLNILK